MAGAFTDALDLLDGEMAATPFDAWACRTAFYDVSNAWVPGVKAVDLHRMVAHCLTVMGLDERPAPSVSDSDKKRSLLWAVETCLENLLIDKGGRNRNFVQRSLNRTLTLGAQYYEGSPTDPIPLPNIPLDPDQAGDMLAPFLDHLERQSDANPLAHLKLCWEVFEFPAPPFDTVFDSWLAALDHKRGTNDLPAIRRAMAFEALSEQSRQCLTWEHCETELLPQLQDPHPLVASGAGRFLGSLYADPDERFVRSTPLPLPQIMDMLAALPLHRRFVAGGFLQGIDCDMNPFATLREEPALNGYDIDAWTLAVFSQVSPEPYLPSAQSFWFHVHEGFCADPAFIMRMIDAGHLWEALMTATEIQDRVAGMVPVLDRLAACAEPSIANAAAACLDRHYKAQD